MRALEYTFDLLALVSIPGMKENFNAEIRKFEEDLTQESCTSLFTSRNPNWCNGLQVIACDDLTNSDIWDAGVEITDSGLFEVSGKSECSGGGDSVVAYFDGTGRPVKYEQEWVSKLNLHIVVEISTSEQEKALLETFGICLFIEETV